jgi:hypothetical protein
MFGLKSDKRRNLHGSMTLDLKSDNRRNLHGSMTLDKTVLP